MSIAAVAATKRGREALGGERSARRQARPRGSDGPSSVERMRGRAEASLRRGSLPVALGVGAILGIPGPFDLVALGHLARGGSATIAVIGLLAAFYGVKFSLIELPILSYAVNPDATGARVGGFAHWMKANKIGVIAGVVALIGIVLIGRGFSRLG